VVKRRNRRLGGYGSRGLRLFNYRNIIIIIGVESLSATAEPRTSSSVLLRYCA
jgi:hypothetical protein